jgi:hypothetical protein
VASRLVEEAVLVHQTGITVEKGHNFLSDHWIALKILNEFLHVVCLVVPKESLLVEEYALSLKTETTAKNGYNF